MRATSENNRSPAPGKTEAGNTDRSAGRAGGIAVIIAGLAGIAMFTLELMGPVLGFDDTDNPVVSLEYLSQYPQIYALAAVAAFIMAFAYIVASFAVSDVLAPRISSLTRRCLSALGLLAAAFLFMHGVLRDSVGPMLYLDSINSKWGESAYLTVQMLGTHGFLAAGLIALGVWSAGICVTGAHSRSLPIWLCVLGLVASLRLVILMAGPLMTAAAVEVSGIIWVASIALIPFGMLWWLVLGVVLLVKSRRNQVPPQSRAATSQEV